MGERLTAYSVVVPLTKGFIMGIPDWSGFDKVQLGGGREEWVRPLVNNGSFYDFGEWTELTPPTDFASLGGAGNIAPLSARKDSNGTVYLRGAILGPVMTLIANGFVALVLPEGFRPVTYSELMLSFGTLDDEANPTVTTGPVACAYLIDTDGNMQAQLPTYLNGEPALDFIMSLTTPRVSLNFYGSFPTKRREDLTGVLPTE